MTGRSQRTVVGLAVGLLLLLPGWTSAAAAPNATVAASASTAFADPPIAVNASTWTPFNWESDGRNIEGPFTFSSSRPVLVKLTDAACRGDQFELFDFGVSIGTTPAVPVDQVGECDPFITDPDIAFQDPSYSHGSFALGPGSHSITIVAITNPFGAGTGFIRVDFLPLPTSKEQCKNGGWRNFPQFKNEGLCITFVNHGS
jgi:hypothetical protein